MNRLAVLTYHSLDESGSPISVSPRQFADHLARLRDLPVRVVGLEEICRATEGQEATEDLVAITFDDGYRNVLRHGAALLQRHGFVATAFLVTGYCGRTNAWPGQPAWVPREDLLDWSEIRALAAAGMAFGSHTHTHRDLRSLSLEQVRRELVDSKSMIEDALGQAADALAYPYGSHDVAIRRLAEKQYGQACSTALGFVESGSDRFALPRLDAYYLRPPAIFGRMFSPEGRAYLAMRAWVRRVRRGRARGYRHGPGDRQ